MNLYLRFAKRFSLLLTPLVATSVLFTSPSQAATFAFSEGELLLEKFSGVLSGEFGVDNSAENVALTNGSDDSVNLNNNPINQTSLQEVFTFGQSTANGKGRNYFGLAGTDATIVGNFDIEANQTFAFDFSSFLNQETKIDTPIAENAQASSDVAFYLFDTSDIPVDGLSNLINNLLDNPSSINRNPFAFFSLAGNLSTLGEDSINQNGQGITLSNDFSNITSNGNEEFATASFAGSFQRYFNNPANVTLIATRRSQARVTAPEPSTSLALLLFLALLVIANKGRLRENILGRSYEVKVIKLTVED
ncbi:hypothetical protein SD81_002335 [Tolypothrix campylonemoides VB511288]|nr:hypothetical protein SD81_002335 [Tolypothrix campylonemoides VB511288]